MSPTIVNREIALLKHMFNLAERWEFYRGRNPVRDVKFLAEDKFHFRFLREAGEETLRARCSLYLQDLLVFTIHTGLRRTEIFNLRWKEVDLEDGVIKVVAQKNQRPLEVPLSEKALAVVQSWHGILKSEYVFYNLAPGGRWKDLRLGLQKACPEAGIERVTWHTFRHTFATRLTRAGADLVTVKEPLGHSAIAVTMRYAHSNLDAKVRAVELLSHRREESARGLGSDNVLTMTPRGKKA